MADSDFQPILAGGPQLATPDYGETESTTAAHGADIGSAFMSTAGAQLVERGVNKVYADTHGGDAIVPQDKAVQMLKNNNYDPSGVPKEGWSESALTTEMERQQRQQDATLATSRANLSSTGQFVDSLVGGLGDPLTLAAGPALGKVTGLAEGTLAKIGVGAAEGAGITGGEEATQNHLEGHDEDSLSWTMVRDMTLSAAPGGLMHSVFGAKPIARPGEALTLDNVDALERSDAAAKRMGITADQVVSPAGAVGRYQIMPATARGFGLKGTDAEITDQLKDPEVNKRLGGQLLDQLARRYGNDPEAIAVAYNAGPRVADHWKAAGRDDSTLPNETRGYLSRLRGVPFEDRADAAKLSVAQLNSDSPVDVDPIAMKPRINAFSIQDDHDAEVNQLHTQAMKDAVPKRDSIFEKMASEKEPISAETTEINPDKEAYDQVAKDAEDRVNAVSTDDQKFGADEIAPKDENGLRDFNAKEATARIAPQVDQALASGRKVTANIEGRPIPIQSADDLSGHLKTIAASETGDHLHIEGTSHAENFKTHMEDEMKSAEIGTLQHDEVTKGVQAALQCGLMKGVTYGVD